MTPFGVKITAIILVTGMFYFVIQRFFILFHGNPRTLPLIITIVLACITIGSFFYQGENKIIDIIATFAGRLFVLSFLSFLILIIEYIIGIRFKVNPRIFIGFMFILLGAGAYFSLHTKITNLDIKTDKIDKDTKILLVSDIHVENVMRTFHINKILETIKSEKPNFVIIAGDLMNKPNNGYVDYFSVFKSIKNIPIFAVIGNHDVMGNKEIVKKIPKISGIKFLNNESVEVDGVQIIGLIDKSLRGNNNIEKIINQIRPRNNSDLFSILISHQPIGLEELQDYPIDLEVAGHTHRGQFYGMRKIVKLVNNYVYGEYKLGDKTAFVTQGIGTWGLPFRLGTQSEMVIINLIKK